MEDVIAAFPNVTVVAFADDVRFLGPAVDALDAAALYREKVEELGHEFQAAKGFVFSHTQATLDAAADHPLSALMQVRRAPEDGSWMRTPEEGLKILGAPYGADDWCEAFLDGINFLLMVIKLFYINRIPQYCSICSTCSMVLYIILLL